MGPGHLGSVLFRMLVNTLKKILALCPRAAPPPISVLVGQQCMDRNRQESDMIWSSPHPFLDFCAHPVLLIFSIQGSMRSYLYTSVPS